MIFNSKKMKLKLYFVLCLFVQSFITTTVFAQDTILFTYDEAKERLSIVRLNPTDGWDIHFKFNTNEFSEKVHDKSDYRNNSIDSNGFYLADFLAGEGRSISKVDWFDTIQCANFHAVMTDFNRLLRCPIKVVIEHKPVIVENEVLLDEEEEHDKVTFNKTMVLAFLVVVVVILFVSVAVMLLRKKCKRKKEATIQIKAKTAPLEMVEVVENKTVSGLDYMEDSKLEYYVMDMQKDYADTAVKKIFIHHTVVKKMYDFFKQSLESSEKTNETGCYFVGCWEYADSDKQTYNITLEEIVEPGSDIQPGEFSFNFGLEIGVNLYSKIEELANKTGRDYVHTVWMHSHPGLGLFLSSHDLMVQQQLTFTDAKKRLVAFVIDTNTPRWDFAVFTTKNDGTMNNKENLTHIYSLEDIYNWSRKVFSENVSSHDALTEEVVSEPDPENYHAVQVNHQGNRRTLNVYFNGRSINAIDDMLYNFSGQHKATGWIIGSRDKRGNLVVDDCIEITKDSEKQDGIIGLFVVDSTITDDDIVEKYIKDIGLDCIFVGSDDDDLLILTRDENRSFLPLADAAVCSMRPLKEWLRRKRIYK